MEINTYKFGPFLPQFDLLMWMIFACMFMEVLSCPSIFIYLSLVLVPGLCRFHDCIWKWPFPNLWRNLYKIIISSVVLQWSHLGLGFSFISVEGFEL